MKRVIQPEFIPATLKENKRWYVEYYVKTPITKEMQRYRIHIKKEGFNKLSDRRAYGNMIAHNINSKLYTGWNPFMEQPEIAQNYILIVDAIKTYTDNVNKRVLAGQLRKETVRSYLSQSRKLKGFVEEINPKALISDLNKSFCLKILDKQKSTNSAITHNNFIRFLVIFFNFLIERGYLYTNPAVSIKKLPKTTKKRQIIPNDVLQRIFNHFKKEKDDFLIICYLCLYCLIRPKEILYLKIKNVDLKKSVIYLETHFSKKQKNEIVTIPSFLIEILSKYIKKYKNKEDFYLFSFEDKFKPGKKNYKIHI